MVKEGSLWADGHGGWFRVLHVLELEGNTWVHYRTEPPKGQSTSECKEYSCFAEAFEVRFQERAE
jgi:hypothetical protein